MAGSIAGAVARLKGAGDPLGALGRGAVEAVCEELGHAWRDRTLDPATTVALFAQQVLHGNCPCSEVRHLAAGKPFTPGAYCQARARLPLAVYRSLLTRVVDAALPHTREADHRWRGHRVFHVDGTTFSMPDTPQLQKAFGHPHGQARGCSFPAAHLLVLFSASTGLLLDTSAGPLYTGDVGVAAGMHPHLDAGDVLVGDDAFGTWAHIALLVRADLHGLFPVHHSRIVDFTPGRPHCPEGKGVVEGMPRSRWVKSLGRDDQLVEWFKPKTRPAWMSERAYADLPESITVRELRRTVTGPAGNPVTLTMVTTLTDPRAYPAEGDRSLTELRMRRWDVETNIRHLKGTMRLDVLRCKTEAGVRKELVVFGIVYNLVRVVMLEAARRQDVPVARVSFADAYRWLRHARPGDVMPPLLLNPHRPGRAEPRAVKRRAKPHDLMNKPRDALRKALKNRGKRLN
jgi:DDE family transposase